MKRAFALNKNAIFFCENIKYLLLLMILLVFYRNNHSYLYILLFTFGGYIRFNEEPSSNRKETHQLLSY